MAEGANLSTGITPGVHDNLSTHFSSIRPPRDYDSTQVNNDLKALQGKFGGGQVQPNKSGSKQRPGNDGSMGNRENKNWKKGTAANQADNEEGAILDLSQNFTSHHILTGSMHSAMSEYAKRTNGHRNLCNIIDFQFHSRPSNSQVKKQIYVISESYNLSLFDLYCTSQAEKTQLSQEFLIETSFQVLKALQHLNSNTNVNS